MSFIKGKGLRLQVDGLWLWHATSCSFASTSKTDNVATKDSDGDIVTISGTNYTLAMDGLYATDPDDEETHVTADELMIKHKAGELIPWQFRSPDSRYVYAGFLYITQGSLSAPVEGNATASFSFTGSGDYTITAVTP